MVITWDHGSGYGIFRRDEDTKNKIFTFDRALEVIQDSKKIAITSIEKKEPANAVGKGKNNTQYYPRIWEDRRVLSFKDKHENIVFSINASVADQNKINNL